LAPRPARRPLAAALAALVAAGVAVLAIAISSAGAADNPTGTRTTPADSGSAHTSTGTTPTDAADPTPTGADPTGTDPTGPPRIDSTRTDSTATPSPTQTSPTPSPTATGPTPSAGPDRTPPVIVAKVVGKQGSNGWYIGDVRISWVVTDAESKVTGITGCGEVLLADDAVARVITCAAESIGGSANTTVIINRDTTPPVIHCPAGAQRIQGSAAILEATVTDGESGPTAPTVSVDVPTATLGTVAVSLTASDVAGNVVTSDCDVDVLPDKSTPDIGDPVIVGPLGQNGWFVGDISVSFPVSEPDSTLLSAVGCGPQIVAADSPGAVVTCTATSAGGTATRTATVPRDATGPVITCPVEPSIIQGSSRSLQAAVSDAISGPAVVSVSGSLPSITLRGRVIPLSAYDLAGNRTDAECGYLVVPDPTPPAIAASIQGLVGPSTGEPAQAAAGSPWYIGPVSVSFSVTDDQSILLDQSGCGTTIVGTDTASQVITCTATSYGGPVSRSVVVALDMTPPVVTCAATPKYVQGSLGTVSATFSDATSGPTALGATQDVDTSTLGLSYVTLTTRDTAGNVGSGSCPYRVVADDTKPVIVPTIVGTSVAQGWYNGPVTVSFSVSDPDSPVTDTQGCDPVTVTADTLSQVVAVCRATTWGGTSVQPVTISRDSVAPIITCLPLRFVQGTAGKATANAQDAMSGVESESVSQTADTSTPGIRAVTLTSTDRAGNKSSQRCTYDVVERKAVAATKLSGTGSDVAPMVLGGIVLALAGTMLAIVARRRPYNLSRHRRRS
jgi:hypothetical protein